MPKIVVSIQTLSHLSSTWLVHINYLKTSLCLYNCHRNLLYLWQLDNYLLDKVLVGLLDDFWFFLFFFLLLFTLKCLDKWFGRNDFHEFEWENGNLVSFNVLLDHSGEFNNFISAFFLFVLNLTSYLEWLMLLTEHQILDFLKIQLFHINFFLPGTFRMIILPTLWLLTFHTSPCLCLFACKTFMLEPFLFNILNPFDIYRAIFLFKITLRYPNRTNIVHPHIMTAWLLRRVRWLVKVIIVQLLLWFIGVVSWVQVFLLLLVVRATFWVFVVGRICLLEQIWVYVDVGAFHGSSSDVAQRARKINSGRSKSQTNITDPALGRHFGQTYTSLMQTNVTCRTKHNQVIISVISISANLAFSILKLRLSFFFFDQVLTSLYFVMIYFLLVLFHILEVFLFLLMQLKHKI